MRCSNFPIICNPTAILTLIFPLEKHMVEAVLNSTSTTLSPHTIVFRSITNIILQLLVTFVRRVSNVVSGRFGLRTHLLFNIYDSWFVGHIIHCIRSALWSKCNTDFKILSWSKHCHSLVFGFMLDSTIFSRWLDCWSKFPVNSHLRIGSSLFILDCV